MRNAYPKQRLISVIAQEQFIAINFKEYKMIKRTVLALSLTVAAMSSHAGSYNDTTPNNSFAAAPNINPYFTTEFSPDVGDSTGKNTSLAGPWVTISGQGNGAADYFGFDVSEEGQRVTLDIDYTGGHSSIHNGFDAAVALWAHVGPNTYSLLGWNDTSSPTAGAGGSMEPLDSFLTLNLPVGHYFAGVSQAGSNPSDTGWNVAPLIGSDRNYTLQVQVSAVPEPEIYAMLLIGFGVIGAISRRRKRFC